MVAVLVFLRVVDIFKQVVEVVGNEVRQVIIFRVLPTLFHGVQFRSIRRKPLEGEPVGMMLAEEGRCCSMHAVAIPNQDHPATMMMMQLPQKPNEVVSVHVFAQQLEVMR